VTDKQNKWSQWLHLVEWWYNSTYDNSAKMTHFQAFYGYELPKWKAFALIDTKVQAVKNHLEEEQKIIKIVKQNLDKACNQMKQLKDQHGSERVFEEGYWLFVRFHLYKKLSLKQKRKNKLAPKFYGPFRINKKISKVVDGLELQDNCCIHNVFHVSCLKKVFGKAQLVQTKTPECDDKGRIILEPKSILSTKENVLCSRTIKEYLI
jgi:hypothetical protein